MKPTSSPAAGDAGTQDMPVPNTSLLPAEKQEEGAEDEDRDPVGDRDQRIREAAYRRYEQRGGASGQALDDWLAAEAEVAAGDDASPATPA